MLSLVLLATGLSQVPDGYQACSSEMADGLYLCWNLDTTASTLALRLTARTDGWLALGFGSQMIGSDAVVGWMDDKSVNRSFVGDYHLGAKDPTQVVIKGNQKLISSNIVEDDPPSTLVLSFTRHLAVPGAATLDPSHVKLIWARGDLIPENYVLAFHSTMGLAEFNFISGDVKRDTDPWKRGHAVCMGIAYGILFPAGMMFARFGKSRRNWFQMHRGIQLTGVIVAAIGFGIAFSRFPMNVPHLNAHKSLGITLLVFTISLPIAGMLRPKKDSGVRAAWFFLHSWGGRLLIIMAVFQIYLGLALLKPGVGWTVFVVLGMIMWLFLFIWLHVSRQRQITVDNLGMYNHGQYADGVN